MKVSRSTKDKLAIQYAELMNYNKLPNGMYVTKSKIPSIFTVRHLGNHLVKANLVVKQGGRYALNMAIISRTERFKAQAYTSNTLSLNLF